MELDLYVDTSRKGVSMALASANTADGSQARYEEVVNPEARGETLGNTLDGLLERMQATLDDVKRVMVTLGPGSFSGLRTGVAFCQGLCFSGKRALYGVSTLQALECFGTSGNTDESGNPDKTAVAIRARTGFWYVRTGTEERFIETEEAIAILEKSRPTTVVVDEAAKNDKDLNELFARLGAKTVLDTGLPLNRWATLFKTVKPSLIQEANYIQPSYFEKLKA